jgi:hypothetical protein
MPRRTNLLDRVFKTVGRYQNVLKDDKKKDFKSRGLRKF